MQQDRCRCSLGVNRTQGMGRRRPPDERDASVSSLYEAGPGCPRVYRRAGLSRRTRFEPEASTEDALALRGPSGEIAALTH